MELVGIVNVTPDSFSDGGSWLNPRDAILHSEKLLAEGASIIEIGGDSTRPGSICVGAEEEWRRIKEVVREVSKLCRVSVDTHHEEVARFALESGAWMINDIFGGRGEGILRAALEFQCKVVLMASRLLAPHVFGEVEGPIVEKLISFLRDSVARARKLGLKDEQLILDTGMGAFISDDPNDSWEVIRSYEKFDLGFPLLLGVSRKGFLKVDGERSPSDRDLPSFYAAMEAWRCAGFKQPAFLRVHNVKLHRELLKECVMPEHISKSASFS